jgi:hypothetical protein
MGDKFDYNQYFDDPTLCAVVTISEACAMWDKSRRYLQVLLDRGQINGRKSTTGGSILISRASLVRKLGEPVFDDVSECFLDGDK